MSDWGPSKVPVSEGAIDSLTRIEEEWMGLHFSLVCFPQERQRDPMAFFFFLNSSINKIFSGSYSLSKKTGVESGSLKEVESDRRQKAKGPRPKRQETEEAQR